MDTRQLKTIVAIVAQGTFAKAGDAVGLTPSAVSQQVHALETELGATLFDRTARPPKLTPEGMQVLEMAKNILREEADAKASLKGEKIAGTLMIGAVRTSALNLLPRAMVQMRAQYPQLKTNLRISLSSPLIADVAGGRLDAAIVADHMGIPPSLRWIPFLREPLWLIAPKETSETNALKLLRETPYVRFRSPVPLANVIDAEISRLGIVTQDIAEIDTIGSIVTCVRQGLGVSIVPQVALQEPEDLQLVKLAFGDPQLTRQIGIVERTVSPRAEIIARLHDTLATLSGEHGLARAPSL
nr:LysR substrate-binding domain-containing protein [Rhizobium halophytocola]